jgi:hypothetical protein
MACPCGGCIVGQSRALRMLKDRLREAALLGDRAQGLRDDLSIDVRLMQDALSESIRARARHQSLKARPVIDALLGALWIPPKAKT